MDRRTAFISSALALAAVGTATTASAGNKGGFKRTVLYGTPKNPQEFDKYYWTKCWVQPLGKPCEKT